MNAEQTRRAILSSNREEGIRQLVQGLTNHALAAGMFRSCLNCAFWNDESVTQHPETCRAFGNQRPPAKVIVTGCDGHSDEIPY